MRRSEDNATRWQFSLRGLFIGMTVIASAVWLVASFDELLIVLVVTLLCLPFLAVAVGLELAGHSLPAVFLGALVGTAWLLSVLAAIT